MKKQIINNIQNDLRRISKWAAELDKDLPQSQIKVFLAHALKDFNKLTDKHSLGLRAELEKLSKQQSTITQDPLTRLRWAEKILTISCRL